MKKVAMVIAFLISLPFSNAYASNEDSILMGAGSVLCSKFSQDIQTANKVGNKEGIKKGEKLIDDLYFTWVQGYWSGLNMMTLLQGGEARALDRLSSEKHLALLHDTCDKNPEFKVMDAAGLLYAALPKNQEAK